MVKLPPATVTPKLGAVVHPLHRPHAKYDITGANTVKPAEHRGGDDSRAWWG